MATTVTTITAVELKGFVCQNLETEKVKPPLQVFCVLEKGYKTWLRIFELFWRDCMSSWLELNFAIIVSTNPQSNKIQP